MDDFRKLAESAWNFCSFSFHNIVQDQVFDLGLARFKDGVDLAVSVGVQLVPSLQPHQPDARVGLCIEVAQQHALAESRQAGGGVYNEGGLTNSAFVVKKADFSRHARAVQHTHGMCA